MKIRIKFRKWGAMKFVGHLDMMRYFQKAIRRSGIDICYSEGFSPHQIMSFAAPLGVGITSDGEYFDIEVRSTMGSAEAVRALNATMVDGVEVTGYVQLPDHAKTAMSVVAAADYELTFKEGYELPFSYQEAAAMVREDFWEAEQFTILKKTKKSEREVDLKPLVYELEIRRKEEGFGFFMKLSTGSIQNIKPELVLASLFEKRKIAYNENAIQIHRLEVYANNEEEQLLPLSDFGTVIAASQH